MPRWNVIHSAQVFRFIWCIGKVILNIVYFFIDIKLLFIIAVSNQRWCSFKSYSPTLVTGSASFLAEISGSSPQKLIIFIIYKNIFWFKNIFYLILKKEALVTGVERLSAWARLLAASGRCTTCEFAGQHSSSNDCCLCASGQRQSCVLFCPSYCTPRHPSRPPASAFRGWCAPLCCTRLHRHVRLAPLFCFFLVPISEVVRTIT